MIQANNNEEKLTPLQLSRLLCALENLSEIQITEYLCQGLIKTHDSINQMKQQRNHTSLDM